MHFRRTTRAHARGHCALTRRSHDAPGSSGLSPGR